VRWPSTAFQLPTEARKSFFQPDEGGIERDVVFPVREIGEVIFADFFRQIFAGV